MDYKSWVSAIKDTIPFEAALRYCGIRHDGNAMLCPNPEHGDRHLGSCTFDSYEKRYHCWACHASGDMFNLVQEKMGYSFQEACTFLVNKYNEGNPQKMLPTKAVRTKSTDYFPFSPAMLEVIGITSSAHIYDLQLTQSYKPSDGYIKDRSEPGEYTVGSIRKLSIPELYAKNPRVVQNMIYYKAQETYNRNCTEYNEAVWNTEAFRRMSIEEKRIILDRKHKLEDSFAILKKIISIYNLNWVFPAIQPDPKAGYALQL